MNCSAICRLALLVSVHAPFSVVAVRAQEPSPARTVTLIEQDGIRGGRSAMVILRPNGTEDVIIVASQATPADLRSAFRTLAGLRSQYGDMATQEVHAVVQSFSPPASWKGKGEKLDAIFLQQLRRTPVRVISRFGNVRAISIKVPAP